MSLTKIEAKIPQSVDIFLQAEEMFNTINEGISNQNKSNLMFNMILHYNFMLNDFSTTVERDKRLYLLELLRYQVQVNQNNVLFKESLILIQQVFVEDDPSVLLEQIESKLQEV